MLIGRRAGRPEGRRTRPARRSAPRNGSRGRSPQTFALSSAASSPAGVSGDREHVLLKLKCALSGPARGVLPLNLPFLRSPPGSRLLPVRRYMHRRCSCQHGVAAQTKRTPRRESSPSFPSSVRYQDEASVGGVCTSGVGGELWAAPQSANAAVAATPIASTTIAAAISLSIAPSFPSRL